MMDLTLWLENFRTNGNNPSEHNFEAIDVGTCNYIGEAFNYSLILLIREMKQLSELSQQKMNLHILKNRRASLF